jgi:hypothetical protein
VRRLDHIQGRTVGNEGTELAKNGLRLALVSGEEFVRAYLRIWLGEDPLDRELGDQWLKER